MVYPQIYIALDIEKTPFGYHAPFISLYISSLFSWRIYVTRLALRAKYHTMLLFFSEGTQTDDYRRTMFSKSFYQILWNTPRHNEIQRVFDRNYLFTDDNRMIIYFHGVRIEPQFSISKT